MTSISIVSPTPADLDALWHTYRAATDAALQAEAAELPLARARDNGALSITEWQQADEALAAAWQRTEEANNAADDAYRAYRNAYRAASYPPTPTLPEGTVAP